ncbi:RNA polymerase sigma-70 factor [Flavisolibacter sp. BT320]|nr:RNA polymerase sigma-70 factor [Flavisolibacter longurius]
MDTFSPLPDERAVLHRLKQSDEAAFAQLYNGYWKPLFYLAATRLKSLTDAEEVVQDIFLDIWNRREELVIACLSSYLAVAVKYKVITLLAKKARLQRQQQSLAKAVPLFDSSAEASSNLSSLQRELEKQTARLPEKCRLVFRLSREKGYSHKEIAAQLRISEKTVESHLTKALRQLRATLQHNMLFFILAFTD